MLYEMQPARRIGTITRSNARRRVAEWPMTAAAAAVAAVMAFGAVDANALALGRIKVMSTLGEPLRAEIDIPEISAAEAESLRASPASPETFRAAGLEFDSVISTVRVAVQRRANGRPFLRLSSSRAVSDPFMDLIIDVTSSSGQISRDFTMLFDPQGGRGSAPSVIPPVAQGVARADAVAAATTQSRASGRATSVAAGATSAGNAGGTAAANSRRAQPAARPNASAETTTAAAATESASSVTVRRGDTASRIAAANLPTNVSLDQMLVAMLRSNPGAFVNGNVNRIKAGAVLEMPSAAQVAEQTGAQARETLNAQSSDFNAYRRKLATAAAPAPVQAADRADSGKLQTAVQENNVATTSPDKLTLSKGSVDRSAPANASAGGPGTGEAAGAAAAADSRLATGSATPNPAGSMTGSNATATVAEETPAAGANNTGSAGASTGVILPSATGTGAASGTSTAAVGSGTGNDANAGLLAAGAKPTAAAEPGLVDQMLEEPLLPAAGIGLLALLAGFGIWRSRRHKRVAATQDEDGNPETGSESIFSMSGGRSIDTLHGSTGVASIAYSASQLDAGGEVDPVAEADVYMAYGREEQALEILKEALRTTPERADVRVKLLEVHARRREAKAFEALAKDTRAIVGTDSREWRHICEVGRELDFKNSLYQAPISAAVPLQGGDSPMISTATGETTAATALSDTRPQRLSSRFGELSATAGAAASSASWQTPQSLDLDLDFGALKGGAASPTRPAPVAQSVELDLDLSDFGSLDSMPNGPAAERSQSAPVWLAETDGRSTKPAFVATNGGRLPTSQAPMGTRAKTLAAAPADTGVIDFDFSSLRLELDNPVETPRSFAVNPAPSVIAAPLTKPERAAPPDHAEADRTLSSAQSSAGSAGEDGDSLSTKLALAEAFSAIGDVDGARSLANEVIGESSGTLKAKAQRFLASID